MFIYRCMCTYINLNTYQHIFINQHISSYVFRCTNASCTHTPSFYSNPDRNTRQAVSKARLWGGMC